MSQIIVIGVTHCANIGCNNALGYYETRKGKRFCKSCNVFNGVLRWKCKTCNKILDNTQFRETRKYCPSCSGYSDNEL